jgi:hypothetical protein
VPPSRANVPTLAPRPRRYFRPALVDVDAIDGLLTRNEVKPVALAAKEAGAAEVICLAWEFEMDLKLECQQLAQDLGLRIRIVQIPREIMEKNRTDPPPLLRNRDAGGLAGLQIHRQKARCRYQTHKIRPLAGRGGIEGTRGPAGTGHQERLRLH